MKRLFNIFFSIVALMAFGSAYAQQPHISNFRSYGQDGLNVFETSKLDTVEFTDLRVRIGGNFAQQLQMLKHSNAAILDVNNDGTKENELYKLANGFNTATANLNIDVQLADGVRMNLVSYMSSRHHNEFWVKGGFIQFDKLPFIKSELVDKIMRNTTIKVGHMEVNYGDAHYRRTDNGNALYNPFVGNYILDAFTTEIGGEIVYQKGALIFSGSMTGGEIKGDVAEVKPAANDVDDKLKRSPVFIAKLGFDKQLSDDFRLRLTNSTYTTSSSARNTLYAGDRTGSRYYLVMENTAASAANQFTSGRFNPGFTDAITANMTNLFVKFKGLEVFGTYEMANGRMNTEKDNRKASQIAGEALYRFGAKENFFLGARYITAQVQLAGANAPEVTINRTQLGAGWFLTRNILMKAEYVNQEYKDFAQTNILHGGKFNGLMFEAVVGF